MPATVRQYELVYIVHPELTEEQVQQVIAKYNALIASQGGQVERTDIWERRRLAYEIKGRQDGVYIVCVFRGLPSVEAELRRVFLISEDTLRFIIVRPDEEIDTSVPAIQPRDYGQRSGPMPHTPAPPAPVAAAPEVQADAAATEVPDAAEPSDTSVPEIAASDEAVPAEAAEPAPAIA